MGRPKLNKLPVNCKIDGCERAARRAGLCGIHHDRMRLYGRLERVATERGEPLRWLMEAISGPISDSCIEWPFARTNEGRYGTLTFKGAQSLAHRVSIELHSGVTPRHTDYVLHSCDNPGCVNPRHLRTGTPRDNVTDALERRRHIMGSRHPGAKLTEDIVREVRASPQTGKELAARLNVSRSLVSKVRSGKIWRHA